MRTCILMPAYNEGKTIGDIIRESLKYVPDILVINDGSSDNTEKAAGAAGARTLTLSKNSGKGKALKHGFDYAVKNGYDAVITMDADGQHDPEDIAVILKAAGPARIGIVAGNRMGRPEGMPISRICTNFLMSLLISVICRQSIPDTQCGFRLIKCEILKGIRLLSSNYEIESEVLVKTSRLGFKIISVPIKSVYQGQLSLINPVLDTWRFLLMLARVSLLKK